MESRYWINKRDSKGEALAAFCENKLSDYMKSFSQSLVENNLKGLKSVSNRLIKECKIIGALELANLLCKLIDCIDESNRDSGCLEEIAAKVEDTLKILAKDYKFYIEKEFIYTKNNMISTLRVTQYIENYEDVESEIELYEAYSSQWRCTIV